MATLCDFILSYSAGRPFVEPVMMSLKRLAAFVSNDNMDPAKTSSRPRYDAGNRLFVDSF